MKQAEADTLYALCSSLRIYDWMIYMNVLYRLDVVFLLLDLSFKEVNATCWLQPELSKIYVMLS